MGVAHLSQEVIYNNGNHSNCPLYRGVLYSDAMMSFVVAGEAVESVSNESIDSLYKEVQIFTLVSYVDTPVVRTPL